MHRLIQTSVEQSIQAVDQLRGPLGAAFLMEVAGQLARCFEGGKKVLIAGNGGSLCDAVHFAEELTGQFRSARRALPAIALSEPGHLTCVGNDMGFEQVFARGIEALGAEGDLFIGLTTSGNSPNLVRAFEVAKAKGLFTAALLGRGGGRCKGVADWELIINGVRTSDRIQEAHMTALHILVELVEAQLFKTNADLLALTR
jgi:D-sedoheptulose 7-phosphate isomerase